MQPIDPHTVVQTDFANTRQKLAEKRAKNKAALAAVANFGSKEPAVFVHRLGYHSFVSNFCSGSVFRLSGSSINRQLRADELKELEKIAAAAGKEINELSGTDCLRADPDFKPGNKRKLSAAHAALLRGLRMFSERSKSIVKSRATAFYRAAGSRKTFCTLTFINSVDDKTGVSVLNKFLTVLRKETDNLQYLWVAERQLKKTNNIHFHLLLNCRIPIARFNALWVLQQYNSGITRPEYSRAEILKRYEHTIGGGEKKGSIQEILNPVDLRKIKNIGALCAYLTKYITKGNNKQGFDCLIWHCSRQVSQCFTRTVTGAGLIKKLQSFENCVVDRKTGEVLSIPVPYYGNPEDRSYGFFCIIRINNVDRFKRYLSELEQLNKWILSRTVTARNVSEYLRLRLEPEEIRRHFLN